MVQVTADEKATLESWIRATTSEQCLVRATPDESPLAGHAR
jgi:hypothetical protein